MPRKAQIKCKDDKGERVYTVTYLDDSFERQEAVQFFRRSRGSSGLFPAMSIPEVASSMPPTQPRDIWMLTRFRNNGLWHLCPTRTPFRMTISSGSNTSLRLRF